MKTCYICHLEKEISEFYRNSAQKDGHDYSCKLCKNVQNKKYCSQSAEYRSDYYKRNKKRILERQKQRQLQDKEAYLEYRREYKKKYLSTDKGKMHNRKQSSARRARKSGVKSGTYNFYDICVAHNWTCVICKMQIDRSLAWPDPNAVTIEHIIPLALGGDDTKENVAPAHFRCNLLAAPHIRKKVRNG